MCESLDLSEFWFIGQNEKCRKIQIQKLNRKKSTCLYGDLQQTERETGETSGLLSTVPRDKGGKVRIFNGKNNSCLFWHFFNDFRSLFQRRFFVSCENIESKKNLNSNNEKVEKEKRAIANTWIVTRWRVRANYKSGRLVLTHFFPRQNWKPNIF